METSYGLYNVSSTAIRDKSLMSAKAQQLCANIDVYWMTPTCATDQPSAGTTTKHDTEISCCCFSSGVIGVNLDKKVEGP